jgi:hypothetical protein
LPDGELAICSLSASSMQSRLTLMTPKLARTKSDISATAVAGAFAGEALPAA